MALITCPEDFSAVMNLRNIRVAIARATAPHRCTKRRRFNGLVDEGLMKYEGAPLNCPVSKPYHSKRAECWMSAPEPKRRREVYAFIEHFCFPKRADRERCVASVAIRDV
jgi:hypothetical protein